MNAKGHLGFSLLILSLFFLILNIKPGTEVLLTYIIVILLSTLPDIDLRLEIKHRYYTHNILFAILIGLLVGFVTSYTTLGFYKGFLIGFSGIMLHLIADLMTYKKFPILAPFSMKKVALKLFKSDNPLINNLLLVSGFLSFLLYLCKVC